MDTELTINDDLRDISDANIHAQFDPSHVSQMLNYISTFIMVLLCRFNAKAHLRDFVFHFCETRPSAGVRVRPGLEVESLVI